MKVVIKAIPIYTMNVLALAKTWCFDINVIIDYFTDVHLFIENK